ncbi:GEVED domain-containing protein [Anaerobaca lacustris]|uniref:GEVED domain-containing protein n=1 Tax=Anaerobaca lacustris TaxID=3044600 RepID=A0AAW6TVX6_9BACT|nr:GEVED domain-containing protein [Sedimentisphaerales bacterium M17dextr]
MKGSTESRSHRAVLLVVLISIVALPASVRAQATNDCDWQAGQPHKMHWPQLPDFTPTGTGVDLSAAALADDFLCTATGPIRNIHIWTSFHNDSLPKEGADGLTLELTFYSNRSGDDATSGRPGELLWSRTFSPGQYTAQNIHNGSNNWYDPATETYLSESHRQTYQYNFCVQDQPFIQHEGNVYWLGLRVAAPATDGAFAWKTTSRRRQWNSSAVVLTQGSWDWTHVNYPDRHEDAAAPVDLAFVITGGDETTPEYDLGDAPDSTGNFASVKMPAYSGTVAGDFPTVYRTGSPPYGPLHRQPRDAFFLGTWVSLENEADLGPDDDGVNNLVPPSGVSNQDGGDDGLVLPVVMPHLGRTTLDYTVTKTSHLAGEIYINVWCDWNRDGDWNDTIVAADGTLIPEWAVQDHPLNLVGIGAYTLTTPAFTCWHPQADEADPIWVRITISEQRWQDIVAAPKAGGAGPAGGYQYGETEDYYLRPLMQAGPTRYDWGDAPAGYPTLAIHNGARHIIAGPWLGDASDRPDAETDGLPHPNALGDDFENGVSIPPLVQGRPASITVEVSGDGGVVQGWIDFNADKTWQAGEQVFNGFLPDGIHVLSVDVPQNAAVGQAFARFRISTHGSLDPGGPAANGEVEDHEVWIDPQPANVKWCQRPDPTHRGIGIRIDGTQDSPRALADNFQCTSRDRLTHVRLWGSWMNDQSGEIRLVRLRIYADDPAGPEGADKTNPFGKPRPEVLWEKQFAAGQFQENLYHILTVGSQWWWDPAAGQAIAGSNTQIWQLDFEIDAEEAFLQDGSEQNPRIYWLSVEMETTGGQFGWNTRRWPEYFADDAVWDLGTKLPRPWQELRYPADHPCYDSRYNSVDMAFCLRYTSDGAAEPPVTSRPSTITYCPAFETMCPATETKCPATVTQCPTVQTRCPTTETQCPPMVTSCPTVSTSCPASLTQCPTMQTQCPSTETRCPPSVTQCPTTETQCPATQTHCPVFQTRCPAVQTQCPATSTTCPIVETQCPTTETRCPPSVTRCPATETRCPATLTQCPTMETLCPATTTKCSTNRLVMMSGPVRDVLAQMCPVVDTECLSVADYLAMMAR